MLNYFHMSRKQHHLEPKIEHEQAKVRQQAKVRYMHADAVTRWGKQMSVLFSLWDRALTVRFRHLTVRQESDGYKSRETPMSNDIINQKKNAEKNKDNILLLCTRCNACIAPRTSTRVFHRDWV